MQTLSLSSSPRSVAPIFDRLARVYDTEFVQRWGYKPPQDEVVTELRAAGSRRIVDVGCGTGILASRIASELEPDVIVGVDASAGMLDQARARSTVVEWRQGQAEALPLDDGEVDAVVSTTAFHFFDRPKALAEFFRVLSPSGRAVVVTTLSPNLVISRLANAVNWGAPTRDEMRRAFEEAGFQSVSQRMVRRPLNVPTLEMVTVGGR